MNTIYHKEIALPLFAPIAMAKSHVEEKPETKGELFKVIAIDNYDRENVSDRLIESNISEFDAKAYAALLNDERNAQSEDWFYRAVPMSHKLYKYDPNA